MGVKLREKIMKDGSSSLYLDIYHEGKRKYDFLNIHLSNKRKFSHEDKEKRELAERLRVKKTNELLNQETITFDKKNTQEDFYTYFEKFIKEKNKTPAYWDALLLQIKSFSKNKENLSFVKITDDWLLEFQKYLLSKVSNNSALLYMNCLNDSLKTALRKKIISQNPYNSIPKSKRIKRKNVEKTYLTIKELESLSKLQTDSISKQFRQVFLFCCFTGLRWSDVNRIKWNNIIGINKNGKKEKVISFKQKKTKQVEYMPLSKQAINILDNVKLVSKNNEFIFNEIADMIDERSDNAVLRKINRELKVWAEEAGIKKNLHFHVSRHTFATMSLTYGVDLYTVSKLLGHKDITTTTVYAKVVNEQKEKAVAKLPKLNFNKTTN